MNCKPGDLAVITNTQGWTCFEPYIGLVLQLTTSYGSDGHTFWKFEGSLPRIKGWGTPISIDDACLRPIRDPGDDAQDEMLLLVGRPNERIPA